MTASHHEATQPWHTLSLEAVCAHLKTSFEGLTGVEAARRLVEFGPNELQETHHPSPWAILIGQFKNILIVILLIASTLSIFLGHGVEAIAITVIVCLAVLLGFVQEYRAERAMASLREIAAPMARVFRDGRELTLAARELVPGDLIFLRAGDKIPADARLAEAIHLRIEEAVLTGESVPVEKHTSPLANAELGLADRVNMAFAGTTATYGRGRAWVVTTGMGTEFGKIAKMLQTIETSRTPLQQNIEKVGNILARVAFAVVLVIVVLGMVRGQPFVEMLIVGVALAVAVVPEALPAVITISLAIGIQKMVKRHALMRRLAAVETLGSISIICSDKTGTLTQDEMTIRKIWVDGDVLSITGTGYAPYGQFTHDGKAIEPSEALVSLLKAAVLSSDAVLEQQTANDKWHIKGDPTEGALVVAAAKANLSKKDLDARYPRIGEIPFTSEAKRMTTLHQDGCGVTAFAKGAPEVILDACTAVATAKGESALDTMKRHAIMAEAHRMAGEALRVLAVAFRSDAAIDKAEDKMTLLGLVGMIDPPRPEVAAAIQKCEQAGIKPVMITGDHPLTAQAIARELGLFKKGRMLTGMELSAMREAEFGREVDQIEVYARVSPADKLRIVKALQNKKHIVAMTGDGVNDAPALKKADIGIAMGISGTDVTREVASMTLTDDNFASIVAAVEEGRAIFGNIKKYLMYLLSSNTGEVLLMAGATLFGMPLPLNAVQLLYVNLATDGLPALALSVDPPEQDLMQRNPRDPNQGIFTPPVIVLIIVGGLWSGIVNLSLFAWSLHSNRSYPEAMTMTFVSLILIEFLKAYHFRSTHHSVVFHPLANKWLNMAICWELCLLMVILYVPMIQQPFATFGLSLLDWVIVMPMALTISPVLELTKWILRRKHQRD